MMDDDLLVKQQGIQKLIAAKSRYCGSVIGFFGRDYIDLTPKYVSTDMSAGFRKIALGRTMLVDRRMCRAFVRVSPMMDDLASSSSVVWNGEDIFLSLVTRRLTGELPYILARQDGDIEELDAGPSSGPDTVAVSLTSDHQNVRDNFLRQAPKGLQCLVHSHGSPHTYKKTPFGNRSEGSLSS